MTQTFLIAAPLSLRKSGTAIMRGAQVHRSKGGSCEEARR